MLALMEMYLEGVSTRKVSEITEVLCGTNFSKSLVSMLCGKLDSEFEAWRCRLLTESYPYLYVDARLEKVRVDGKVISQGVLITKGLREDGHREILAVEVRIPSRSQCIGSCSRVSDNEDYEECNWSRATTTRG